MSDRTLCHYGHMDVEKAVARTRALHASGNTAGALDSLKTFVANNISSAPARMGLAEHYRQIGSPDHAARWGAVTEGWATAKELDRLARWLAAKNAVTSREVRKVLELSSRSELPRDVRTLLEVAVSDHRERIGQRLSAKLDERRSAETLRLVSLATWIVAGLLFVLGLVVLQFLAILNLPVTTVFARGLGLATTGLMAIAVVTNGVRAYGARHLMAGLGLSALGATMLAAVIVVWVGTGLEFSWERN